MSEDEEEAQSRGFKVSDRRRFVDHGDGAGDGVGDEAAEPAVDAASERDDPVASKAAEPPPAAPVQDSSAGETSTASDAADLADAADAGDTAGIAAAGLGDAGGPFPEMNFSTFVISLMTQALMHLGEVAEEGHPPAHDLPAAKQMIDLLGILREKTTGNLDANEEQLLGQMLYDLRMRYVEVSRGR